MWGLNYDPSKYLNSSVKKVILKLIRNGTMYIGKCWHRRKRENSDIRNGFLSENSGTWKDILGCDTSCLLESWDFLPPHPVSSLRTQRGGEGSWLADIIFCSPTGSWDQLFTLIPPLPFLHVTLPYSMLLVIVAS